MIAGIGMSLAIAGGALFLYAQGVVDGEVIVAGYVLCLATVVVFAVGSPVRDDLP